MVIAVTSNEGDIANAEAAAWEIVKASAKQIRFRAESVGLSRGYATRFRDVTSSRKTDTLRPRIVVEYLYELVIRRSR